MLRFDYNGEFENVPSTEDSDNLNASDSNKDNTSSGSCDKSPRNVNQQQLSNRRQKGLSKCKSVVV